MLGRGGQDSSGTEGTSVLAAGLQHHALVPEAVPSMLHQAAAVSPSTASVALSTIQLTLSPLMAFIVLPQSCCLWGCALASRDGNSHRACLFKQAVDVMNVRLASLGAPTRLVAPASRASATTTSTPLTRRPVTRRLEHARSACITRRAKTATSANRATTGAPCSRTAEVSGETRLQPFHQQCHRLPELFNLPGSI